jgi:peptide/nickel transport system permease protein
MRQYVLRRTLSSLIMVIVVSTITFLLIRVVPGDPALLIIGEEQATPEKLALVRQNLGLDRPLLEQYAGFLAGALHGDLGRSLVSGRPVGRDLAVRIPRTMQLIAIAVILACAAGIPLGILAARRQNTATDLAASVVALLGVSTPAFVVGTLLVLAFSLGLPLLPSSGWVAPTEDLGGFLQRLIMPSVTLSLGMLAVVMRMSRSALLEVIRQDFIRTARAKGVPESAVVRRHALKNSLIPVVTAVGVQMGNLLGGSVIVEQVFTWPGVSTYLITGIGQRDYPIVQAVVLLISVAFVVINLLVDLLYGYLDPRIKYQ